MDKHKAVQWYPFRLQIHTEYEVLFATQRLLNFPNRAPALGFRGLYKNTADLARASDGGIAKLTTVRKSF